MDRDILACLGAAKWHALSRASIGLACDGWKAMATLTNQRRDEMKIKEPYIWIVSGVIIFLIMTIVSSTSIYQEAHTNWSKWSPPIKDGPWNTYFQWRTNLDTMEVEAKQIQ
jgi:hypothetical protein